MIATSFLDVPMNIGQSDDEAAGLIGPLAALMPDQVFVVSTTADWPDRGRPLTRAIRNTIAPCHDPVVSTSSKSLMAVELLAADLMRSGCTRQSVIVACGGGHVGNIAGLTAALLFRGIRLVHVPTTLLAASDSVLSSKQAVNLAGAKNLLGTYHAPSLIWANTDYLDTLDTTQRASGIAELYKNALAVSPADLQMVERLGAEVLAGNTTADAWHGLIHSGVACKESVMFVDPHETRAAVVLEYGHTVGHALEACTGWPHGLAVAFGMQVAAAIAHDICGLSRADYDLHVRLLQPLWRPWADPIPTIDDLMLRVAQDNKRGRIDPTPGWTDMVLLTDLGCPVIDPATGVPLAPVPNDLIADAIALVLR